MSAAMTADQRAGTGEARGDVRDGTASRPVLEVRGLCTEFHGRQGPVRAVENVSFSVPHGGAVAVVGV